MLKAYRYRIYPNKEQEIQLAKTFGCCRFVYNQTLAYRKNAYEKEKKSVSNASWYELTRQPEYKTKQNGRNYIKIDRFYASSQLCFSCGYKNTNVKDLKVRDWICTFCNTKHDRDINAAKNILAEGLRKVV